ncbi:hypothetical protein SD70_18780 [Gordoniibacillus kamchatkensis]|uniref:Uncharacterized protein n=1 Tax=Gordoniibacillus kamchatkensis TaxID=1590651 RepID=A0ABR5AG46_9BACL|nr:hypothetical protein [Paenibacillus sp. VKM B-2647]KIL39678.1 hypothetical protein SD70_18780 [Paenibacillus sp. VKM B-2647]
MTSIRGRPAKYTDDDLKQLLVEVASKRPGMKINPSMLEKETGVKRHVWLRRMGTVIDELNKPAVLSTNDDTRLPNPNVTELVETYWNNKSGLIKALAHYNETLDQLYEQAKLYTEILEQKNDLQAQLELKEKENKKLQAEVNYYKNLYFETAVKSTYNIFQEEEGLSNVVSINKNKDKALSLDLVSRYSELFEGGNEETSE